MCMRDDIHSKKHLGVISFKNAGMSSLKRCLETPSPKTLGLWRTDNYRYVNRSLSFRGVKFE